MIEQWASRAVIKNKATNCDYIVVASGEAEIRTRRPDNKTFTKRVGPGAYFVNQAGLHTKLEVYPGCTVLRIAAATLHRNVSELLEMVDRLRMLKTCLLTSKLEENNIK